MKKNQGMTLVELMVVICIICILATVVLNVGRGVVLKSQIQSTQSTILALSNACEQYHALYYCYPALGTSITSMKPTNEKAKAGYLHFYLECYPDQKSAENLDIEEDPVLTQNLPKKLDTSDPNKNSCYIDAWSNALYVCYGRNHSGDNPQGPNNYNSNYLNSTPLDIISAGPNEKLNQESIGDDYNENNPSEKYTGSATSTNYKFNDPGVDDIVSWMLNINKALRNTRD